MHAKPFIAFSLGASLIIGMACFGFLFTTATAHSAMPAGNTITAEKNAQPCCVAQLSPHNISRAVTLAADLPAARNALLATILLISAFIVTIRRANIAEQPSTGNLPSPIKEQTLYFANALRLALSAGIVHPKIF